MKYIMLIYQGPALEGGAALTEEEKKQVYARRLAELTRSDGR